MKPSGFQARDLCVDLVTNVPVAQAVPCLHVPPPGPLFFNPGFLPAPLLCAPPRASLSHSTEQAPRIRAFRQPRSTTSDQRAPFQDQH